MKIKKTFCLLVFTITAHLSLAEIYYKINSLYALLGIINPAVEIPINKHSSFQVECVASPFLYFTEHQIKKPVHFFIFMNEYRYYTKEVNNKWYIGGNFSLMGFNMYKPKLLEEFKFQLDPYRRSRGYGFMTGLSVGYAYKWKKNWTIDSYFGWAYMLSWYNGYRTDGSIIMDPHGHEHYVHEDPWNASAEWYPNKVGVSIAYSF